MRAAEARRAASTITSSSIRLSFAGGHVDCTMNTSRPRTFSISSTLISPSLKRPTYARPSGVCRLRAISCASAGVALPANSASVSLGVLIFYARRAALSVPPLGPVWLGWKDSNLRMAGSKPAALPLGDTPASVPPARKDARARILQPPWVRRPCPQPLMHGGLVQTPRHEAQPPVRDPCRQALGLGRPLARGEYARARAREVRRCEAREPLERFPHPGGE